MYSSFSEKGKIFTNVVTKKPIDVYIQTNLHFIRGRVHIRPDDRLKDEINQNETFLAVTEAVVQDQQGNTIYKADFLAVNRSQIVWLVPTEELKEN